MVTSLARELAGKSTTDGVVIEVNLPEHAYQKQTIIQHQRNLPENNLDRWSIIGKFGPVI